MFAEAYDSGFGSWLSEGWKKVEKGARKTFRTVTKPIARVHYQVAKAVTGKKSAAMSTFPIYTAKDVGAKSETEFEKSKKLGTMIGATVASIFVPAVGIWYAGYSAQATVKGIELQKKLAEARRKREEAASKQDYAEEQKLIEEIKQIQTQIAEEEKKASNQAVSPSAQLSSPTMVPIGVTTPVGPVKPIQASTMTTGLVIAGGILAVLTLSWRKQHGIRTSK